MPKTNRNNLSNEEYNDMDDFLERVLTAFENGKISKTVTRSGLAHVMAALDKQNTSEAVAWFKQPGVSFFSDPSGMS